MKIAVRLYLPENPVFEEVDQGIHYICNDDSYDQRGKQGEKSADSVEKQADIGQEHIEDHARANGYGIRKPAAVFKISKFHIPVLNFPSV